MFKATILAMFLMLQAAPKAAIVANPDTHTYHVRCTHVESCKKCTTTFATEEEAKTAGFHICPFAKKVKAVQP